MDINAKDFKDLVKSYLQKLTEQIGRPHETINVDNGLVGFGGEAVIFKIETILESTLMSDEDFLSLNFSWKSGNREIELQMVYSKNKARFEIIVTVNDGEEIFTIAYLTCDIGIADSAFAATANVFNNTKVH